MESGEAVAIQQRMIAGIPDCDFSSPSIRLPMKETPNRSFDSTSPAVALPENTFAPYNSLNTMHSYKAFWSLMLPITPGRFLSDIWRGYVSQKLLWTIGGKLSFSTENAVRDNDIIRVSAFSGHERLANKTEELMNFLKTWKCGFTKLDQCFRTLYHDLFLKDFVKEYDEGLTIAWLQDLKNVGYEFPIMKSPKINGNQKNILKYFSNSKGIGSFKDQSVAQSLKYIQKLCPEILLTVRKSGMVPKFERVLLVVVYNHPHTANLKIIKALYKYNFPNIVVCGYLESGMKDAEEERLSFVRSRVYTFINTSNVIDCIRDVILMNYGVDGYLIIQDDIILNFWNLMSYNRSKIWSTFDWRYFNSVGDAKAAKNVNMNGTLIKRGLDHWIHPQDNLPKLQKALQSLKDSSEGSSQKMCHNSLKNRLKGDMRFEYGQCDIFYLPKRLGNSYTDVIGEFIKHDVFFEIACPTTLRCIEEQSLHEELQFSHFNVLANPPRSILWKYYKNMTHRPYIHPYKLSSVIAGDKMTSESFCNDLVPTFINHVPNQ